MRRIAFLAAALALAACAPPQAPSGGKAAPPQAPAPPTVAAPAGEYKLDPNHSSFTFRVSHLGLSNYMMRFTKLDSTIRLDPDNVAGSSVILSIDPTSVRADYPGDYRSTHAPRGRPYRSWDDDLANAPEFLNARQFPEITFRSTHIEPTGQTTARITGDLTLRGQTHPVTLDATLTGVFAQHPFTRRGALGLSAKGTFSRSQFGMTHLIDVGVAGDEVTIEFTGEYGQVAPPGAASD